MRTSLCVIPILIFATCLYKCKQKPKVVEPKVVEPEVVEPEVVEPEVVKERSKSEELVLSDKIVLKPRSKSDDYGWFVYIEYDGEEDEYNLQ